MTLKLISSIVALPFFISSAFIQNVAVAGLLSGVRSFARSLDEPMPVNQSCTVGSFAFGTENATLGVYCNTDDMSDFAYDWTFIDLNLCIGNNNGALASSPGGNFSDSCEDCNVTWSHVDLTPVTTTLTTTPHVWATNTVTSVSTPRWDDLYLGCGGCINRDYQLQSATIDLNRVMVNRNGTIGCHAYQGTTMHAKPEPRTTATTAAPVQHS